jgi:integrase
MASLFEDSRSPYHIACFTAIAGNRRAQWKRSTFIPTKGVEPGQGRANAKLAQKVADELEDAAQGRSKPERVKEFLTGIEDLRARRGLHRVFDEVMRRTIGSGLGGKSVKAFVDTWLDNVRGTVSPASILKYEQTATEFLEWLGGKAEQDMSAIGRVEISGFLKEQARRVSPTTANWLLKIIRLIFAAAEMDGIVSRNEARLVKKLKEAGDRNERRAFTVPELKKLLAVCGNEWRSMVLFGFYTGARLGDVASLTWQNLDPQRGEVTYTSRKTSRTVIIPMAKPLRRHVESLPAGDNPRQPLHPRAYETVMKQGRTATLSNQFAQLMADAGLVAARSHQAAENGKGRAGRRATSEISFHALRHTAVSLLKSAGVSDAVAMDLAGHDSAAVSRLYTHIEDSAKRKAVDRLPKL